DVVASTQVACAVSARQHARAFLSRHVQVAAHGLELVGGNEWPDTCIRLQRIAELPATRERGEALLEWFEHRLLDDHATCRGALLTGTQEGAACDVLDDADLDL